MDMIKDKYGNTIDIYENDIERCIDEYCIAENIDTPINITQSQWNAVLMYVGKTLYKGTDKLKIKGNRYNTYNYELLESIADIYIYLCSKYNKEISIIGFSFLTGMSNELLYSINGNDSNTYSSQGRIKLLQKLHKYNEESLTSVLYQGKRNPVGIIAMLNHRHNWQTAASAQGIERRSKSADELPNLSAPDGILTDNVLENDHDE